MPTEPMDEIRVINKELPKPDKVHLEEKGYKIWADSITPVLEEMMK